MSRVLNTPDALALLMGLSAACLLFVAPLPAGLPHAVALLVIAAMVGWIAWQDMRDFTIPDGPLVAIAVLGAALRLATTFDPSGESLAVGIDALLCGGALLAIREGFYRIKGFDGLGFGDVKLAAAGGMLVGTEGFAHALLAASALGLALVLILSLRRRMPPLDRLPFGAFLAPACGIVWALSLA
jgi:leader peptidase (prepilin peptidase)/N-methyltransferase